MKIVTAVGGASIFALATGCASPKKTSGASSEDFMGEQPLAVFMFMSDPHVTASNPEYGQRLANALEDLASLNHRPQAIVINGDMANDGRQDEYDEMRDIIDKSDFDFESEVFFTCGNHDQYLPSDMDQYDYSEARARVMRNCHMPSIYYDAYVADQHLIFMGPDGIGSRWDRFNITSEQVAWVENLLAADEAAGVNSFVFCHEPLPGTVGGADEGQFGYWGSIENPDELRAVIEKHPRIVFVTGHTHRYPDVRRVSDEHPTYVNEGSSGRSFGAAGGKGGALSNGVEVAIFPDRYELRVRNFFEHAWENPVTIKR